MNRGKRELVKHHPHIAMTHFRAALESIPAESPELVAKAMYWLAVALFRLDKTELAIHALASAQRVGRRGLARRLYLAWVNGYGMIRRASPDLDDLYAYSSLQIGSFLARKKDRRFDSIEERDIVMRIVLDAWKSLSCTGRMAGKSCSEKLDLFTAWKPDFPVFRNGALKRASGTCVVGVRPMGAKILTAKFGDASCSDNDTRCSCGSGLPYCMCCGRIPALRELSGE